MINSTYNPQSVNDFEKSKLQLAVKGVHSSFTAGSITALDLKLTDDHLLTGGTILVKDGSIGDSISLQVVDVDNIIGYGANVVLSEFVTNWYVSTDSQKQIDLSINYPAKILAGLYIRLKYNSTGITAGSVSANYLLHKVLI